MEGLHEAGSGEDAAAGKRPRASPGMGASQGQQKSSRPPEVSSSLEPYWPPCLNPAGRGVEAGVTSPAGKAPRLDAHDAAGADEEVLSAPICMGRSATASEFVLRIPRVWLDEEAAVLEGGKAVGQRHYDAATLPFPVPIGRAPDLLRRQRLESRGNSSPRSRAHLA
jgi:hypothetical protein